VDAYGREGQPLSVFSLARCLYRDAKDIVARVPESLFQAALHGSALPDWLLQQAVIRNQAEQGITYPRAALIKSVFCSQGEEDIESMAVLNIDHPKPAYHCGRVLAELEAIQRLAIPGIKATLVDRYYSGASTAPARVFGTLLNGAQAHLGKLRKERPGAYNRLSQTLESILASLAEFPRTLTVQDQALFSLGYYHQRAADRAAAARAAEARRTHGEQPDLDLEENEESEDE
jgi:CRISPR-associated protein Csd1